MLIMSYMGDQVWLMTSRHTLPDLHARRRQWLHAARAGGGIQLVDVGVEDAVDKADAGALVGILVGQLDVDFPQAALEGRLAGALEADVELLPAEQISPRNTR